MKAPRYSPAPSQSVAPFDRRHAEPANDADSPHAVHLAQIESVFRIAMAVSRARDLDAIYQEGLTGLHKSLGIDRSAVLVLDDHGVMRFKASAGLSAKYRAAVEGHSPWTTETPDPQPIAVPDVTKDESLAAFRELFARERIGALAFVPLIGEAGLLGKFMLYSPEPREFAPDELRLAQTIATHIAIAIGEHNKREAAAAMVEHAQQASRAKSDFLAVMSHELRTPLNAIAGYVELLELEIQGPLTDAQRESLRRIQRSQRHLLSLINDVLNFAKLEGGHLDLDVRDVPLTARLESLEGLLAPQIHAKRLKYDCAPCPPEWTVRADEDRLQQILLNLLSNAIKFTEPAGTISMEADRVGDRIRIHVRDSGPGVPVNRKERIFEPFVQLERGFGRRHDGVGLGLAISRDLARAMGGDVSVVSEMGTGSTFTLTLPAGSGETQPLKPPM